MLELEEYQVVNKDGETVTKKRYPKLYGDRRQEEKREEAEQRKERWDALSDKQKLAELDSRRGESKKQRKKILGT